MTEVEVSQLKRAVEGQHACTATFVQSVPVKETFEGETVWDGVVHVFTINGHPKARKAYAWSSPISASTCDANVRASLLKARSALSCCAIFSTLASRRANVMVAV
jgi:hypothetical protein